MKKLLCILSAVILNVSCSNAQKTEFSKEALSEKLTATDGSQVVFQDILKKYEGKTLVIEAWASWCSDCVKNIPKLKELQANNPDVTYLFLSMDKTSEKWLEGIKKHELSGDHFLVKDGMKGTFGKAIDLDWIPRYIIVDKTGKIVLYRAIETDFEKINNTLKSIQ
ncbi:TlpA disulfide reductase family protein [Flavobacterium sp.]|uniref:TlpA family protein disulfide reductase n=1 Tax=Flavobacterium sp. TaxID=239 RepID=UPI00286DD412|nr:TlpA disulfide reductase family protein [Flavobacterium sp.]